MSLINQMLKDLETRQVLHAADGDKVLHDLSWSGGEQRRLLRFGWWIGGGLVLLILAVVVLYLYQQRLSYAVVPAATVVAQVPPAQPASMAPIQSQVQAKPLSSAAESKPLRPPHVTPSLARPAVNAQQAKVTIKKPVKAGKAALLAETTTGQAIKPNAVKKKLRPLSNHQKAELAYQRGYEALARGRHADGEAALRQALGYEPGHVKAREMLAAIYLQHGRFIEADGLLREGTALEPGYLPFRELLARVLLAQQLPQRAIEVLEQQRPSLKQAPNYYALLAGLYQQQAMHERAASSYLQLVKFRPQQGPWWLGLAISLEKLGKLTEAESAYAKAVASVNLKTNLKAYAEARLARLSAAHASTSE